MSAVDADLDESGTCSNEECPYAETGECALGNAVLDCEHFHLDEPHDEPEAPTQQVDEIQLPSAMALTEDTLHRVLLRRQASIVVPLGHVEAGKTTLMAVIFEHLAAGRLEGWSLAGSLTVLGFGRRSHLAMTRSGRNTADTDHTSRDSSKEYMHIDARHIESEELVSVLFADISGEYVGQQVIGPDDPIVKAAVEGADHIAVFLDGRLAGDPKRLQDGIRQVQDILWSIDALPRRDDAEVCLVVTKADLATSTDLEEALRVIRAGAPSWAADAPGFVTAARSVGDSQPGSGTAEFFGHVARRSVQTCPEVWPPLEVPEPSPLLVHYWGIG